MTTSADRQAELARMEAEHEVHYEPQDHPNCPLCFTSKLWSSFGKE